MRVQWKVVTLALVSGALPLLAAGGLAWILATQSRLDERATALWAAGLGAAMLLLAVLIAAAAGRAMDRQLEYDQQRAEAELKAMGRLVADADEPDASLPADDDRMVAPPSAAPAPPAAAPAPPAAEAGLRPLAEALAAETKAPHGPALRRLLLFSKPLPHRPLRVGVNAAVEVCIRAMQPGRGPAGRLAFDPDPNVGDAMLDADSFHQLLLHLVLSAREAAGPEGRVDVRSQAMDGTVLVAVRDDGPCATGEDLERYFAPFASIRGGAPGLGLALCRKIAAAHGGTISAINLLPRGVEVAVRLPAPAPAAARQDQ